MDYEDDDDGQYQQYEDELYKDPSSDSEGSDELNSDLEDTMLSHVYYSTNVYKKAAAASSAKQAGDQDNSSVSGANRASQNDQLAIPRTPAEDYHQAISRETEQDSESDDNATKKASKDTVIPRQRDVEERIEPKDQEEESRYNVKKRLPNQKAEWNSHVNASKTNKSSDSRRNDPSDNGEDNNADDGDDGSDSGDSGNGDDEEDNEDDEEDDDTLEAKSRVKRARYLESTEPTEQLDEHVLDLGATADDDGDETNYDLKAELGHLEDENFKGRSRYYLDEKERSLACHRCGLSGHLSRNCTTKICNTCGAKGDHTFTDCPFAVCYNCQKKGHLSSNCPYPRGYGVRNFCDKCGLNNHVTEDCPTVWREYVCKSDEPLYNARQYCYNCAAQDHFGDECLRPRPYKSNGSAFSIRPIASIRMNTNMSESSILIRNTSLYTASYERREFHSSSSRQDSRDRRDRDRDRDWDRDRDRNRNRDRDRHRDWDRDRDGSGSRSRDQSQRRDRSRDRDRDRDRGYNRDGDRNSNRSSRDKGRNGSGSNSRTDDSVDNQTTSRSSNIENGQHASSSSDGNSRSSSSGGNAHANDNANQSKKARKPRHKSQNDGHGGESLVPTMATGGNLQTGLISASAIARAGGSMDNPMVIHDSSSSSPSVSSGSTGGNHNYRLRHSLPSNPNRRGQNNNQRSFQERLSIAELNAFPRSGNRDDHSNGSSGQNNGNALIGAPKPQGPMYTGGYNRRR